MMEKNLQKTYEQKMAFNEGVINYLKASKNNKYSESVFNNILSLIHRDNYLQVLYSYGPIMLSDLMNHFLEVENYEHCSKIRDTVYNHNKATGEQIKLDIND